MAAMWNAACRRPSVRLQYLERALVLAQSVRERAVELKPVAVGAHSTVAQQIACIMMTEEVLAGVHRTSTDARVYRWERAVRYRNGHRLAATTTRLRSLHVRCIRCWSPLTPG